MNTKGGPTLITGVRPPEWWQHLRPYNKRRFWKKARAAGKREARAAV